MEDFAIELKKLIDHLQHDYVHVAYEADKILEAYEEGTLFPQNSCMKAIVALSAMHQHTQELLDLLYPLMQSKE